MDALSRLRTRPDHDTLTDLEFEAVLDAAELLEELRPLGFAFAIGPERTLKVKAPRGAGAPVRRRVAGLADALVYVLDVEGEPPGGATMPACAVCGHPAERFTPAGEAVCLPHVVAPHLSRHAVEAAMAELEDEARRRAGGERLPQTPARYRVPAPIAGAAPAPVRRPTAPSIPEGCCEFCPPADRVRATRTHREWSGRDTRLCARHFAPLARVRRK